MIDVLVFLILCYLLQICFVGFILIVSPITFRTRKEFFSNFIPLYFIKYFAQEIKDSFNCLDKDGDDK